MPTSKSLSHTAKDAFKRVKPLLDVLKNDIREAAETVAKEYSVLPETEKASFAKMVKDEYGWSQNRLKVFAQISKDLPKKQKVIGRLRATEEDFDVTTRVAEELVRTDDKLLQKAAKAGMFNAIQDGKLKVSSDDIRKLRSTGKVPVKATPIRPKTDLDKIRKLMVSAEDHMRKASLDIGKIASLMYDSGITDAKGKEATALVKTFEKLCTEFASVNPVTSKRAFQILRGEA